MSFLAANASTKGTMRAIMVVRRVNGETEYHISNPTQKGSRTMRWYEIAKYKARVLQREGVQLSERELYELYRHEFLDSLRGKAKWLTSLLRSAKG